MKVYLFRLAFWTLPRIPYRLVQYGALVVAYLMWRFGYGMRTRVKANLAHIPALADDPGKLDLMVRRCFRALLLNYIDLFVPPDINAPDFATTFSAQDLEPLYAAQAQGKGLIIVTVHCSGSEWARYLIPQVVRRKLVLPMEVLSPPALFDEIASQRSRSGIDVLPVAEKSSLRTMLTTLRHNGAVIIALDRDILQTGVIVPLFGTPTRIPTGPIALARLTGAPIVFFFSWRVSLNRLAAYFVGSSTGIDAKTRGAMAMQQALVPLIHIMEKEIARYPDQWFAAFANDIWLEGPHQ